MNRPALRPTVRFALPLLVGAIAVGCSQSLGNDDAGAGGVFIANASSFSCFRQWASTPGVAPGAPQPTLGTDGGIHSGPMTTYYNRPPPHGSTSFPIGTIIVKEESMPTDLTQRQIFAMVKRGGGYNSAGGDGAVNWEFFELQNVDACNVSIIWSGFPSGADNYASNPLVCDQCHVLAVKNDYVWTQGLDLSSF